LKDAGKQIIAREVLDDVLKMAEKLKLEIKV
jgi:hypothetical protein